MPWQEVLEKQAFLGPVWDKVRDWLNPEKRKARKDVREHYQTKDPAKWDQFIARAAKSPEFIRQLERSKKVPRKDVIHAVNMAGLQKGPTVGEVESESSSGDKYQIRKLPSGDLACTCGDWRYKGSVTPGYECKHIRAHKKGLSKVASCKEKNAAFREKTLEYFDKLKQKRDEQRMEAVEGMRDGFGDPDSPFSSTLTQDEEPSTYNPNPPRAMEDPDIVLGGGG